MENAYVCANRHSYDAARSGYVNLLQPQDRRSSSPGDSKEIVNARARLLAAGIGRPLIDAVARTVTGFDLPETALVVDLGSGTGDALGTIARSRPVAGVGIDLSAAAVDHAARRFPSLTWVVANADRRVPIGDHRAAIVVSLHARRNPDDCARVLSAAGRLILAIPAPDDLIELRRAVQGEGIERRRGETLVAQHARRFTLVDRLSVRDQVSLERDALDDLLRVTYRSGRRSTSERLATLSSMTVTVASDIFVLTPLADVSPP